MQGEGGQDVETSSHWIDKKHLEYWDECIDETFGSFDLSTEVVMIPDAVKAAMK